MSVDLLLDSARPVAVKPLVPKIASVLADLLGVADAPELVVETLEEGKRVPIVSDVIGTTESNFLVVSLAGEPETIGIVSTRSGHVAVTIYGARSNLQYALGAATAITLAEELGTGLSDDRKFFSHEISTFPETLLEHLRVSKSHDMNYRNAADMINWGPGGTE